MKEAEVIARAKSAVLDKSMTNDDMKYLNAVLSHIQKFDGAKNGDRYNFEDIEDMMSYMVRQYNVEPGNMLIVTKHNGEIY